MGVAEVEETRTAGAHHYRDPFLTVDLIPRARQQQEDEERRRGMATIAAVRRRQALLRPRPQKPSQRREPEVPSAASVPEVQRVLLLYACGAQASYDARDWNSVLPKRITFESQAESLALRVTDANQVASMMHMPGVVLLNAWCEMEGEKSGQTDTDTDTETDTEANAGANVATHFDIAWLRDRSERRSFTALRRGGVR